MKQALNRIPFLSHIAALFVIAAFLPAAAHAQDAAAMLARSRPGAIQGERELSGNLRDGSTRIPFQLSMRGAQVLYQFRNPPRTYSVRFSASGAALSESTRGGSRSITGAAREETLFETNISMSDLALDFLYWPRAAVVGTDRIKGRQVDVLDVFPGKETSSYGRVRIWADQATGGLMKAEAYDPSERLLKRMEVNEIQPHEGSWILRRMRVESFNPETRRVSGRSYLEIDDQRRN